MSENHFSDDGKIRPENYLKPSDKELAEVAEYYTGFFKARNDRSGNLKQFKNHTFEDFLKKSRELFWNANVTDSEDLKELDLEFSLPFTRKEVMEFLSKIVSQNISPKLSGEGIGIHGVKVLQGLYKKWRLKSNDKVEKFWETLYSIVNGTVCLHVGFNGQENKRRYLRAYDSKTGEYSIDEITTKLFDDVFSEVVPIEEMYLSKIWERNIQKQGITYRLQEMTFADFKASDLAKYSRAGFVQPGNMISEQSLYFTLLGGSGIISSDRVQILRPIDTNKDKAPIIANGIVINALGKGDSYACPPNPFHHKMQPYVWSVHEPIDNNFAYGLSTPFKLLSLDKLENTSFTMMVERELRAIDPPVLTSDFEAPQIIFGQKKVIPVNDVNAYKDFQINEASGAYFTMMNSLQGLMSSFAQGGSSAVAPSKQPKSAREVIALDALRQQSLGNALITYYDMVRQELLLVLKTALQFYSSGKYDEAGLYRTINVPNFPLTTGGVGNLEIRVVNEPQHGLALYFEAVKKSVDNGKPTEIIEIPVSILQNLEFYIDDIKLEPEKATELERASYFEQVLSPILNVFVPAGVADLGKTYLRFLEKMGEHPSDYSNDQTITQLGYGGKEFKLPVTGEVGGRQGMGNQMGNVLQQQTGAIFGGQSGGGQEGAEGY